ncbi:MAG: PAS domain S-box protein [Thermomicrobiales bacterium]
MSSPDDATLPSPVLHELHGTAVDKAGQDETTPALLLDHAGYVFQSCPDPMIGTALDGAINFWNRAAEQVYGYPAETALGLPLSFLAPPGHDAEMANMVQRVLRGDLVEAHETALRARDGRLFDVSLSIFPVRDAHGRIIGASATSTHVRPQQPETSALEASERRFRTAFDDAPNGIALLDLDGRFLQANRAACLLLGRSEAELLTMSVEEILHPDDIGLDDVAAEHALAGGDSDPGHEMRLQRPDGSVRWIRAKVSVIHGEDGEPAQFIAQTEDLTDQVQAREQLALARRQTQELLERVSGAFIEVDADWRIVRINAATEDVLSRPRSELVGHRLQDVAPPGSLEAVMAALQTTMTTRQRTEVAEFACEVNGAWLMMRAYPTGKGLSIYLYDVSTERHLEQELRVAELRFQGLVEQLPAAVFMSADDGERTVLYMSPYVERLTGFTAERHDVFGSFATFREHIHPDDLAKVLGAAQARGERPDQFAVEYRFRRADGTYAWISDISSPMVDDAGQIIAWLGILIDITAQKEASDAIARLAAIVEGSEDAIYTRTLDGIISYWNPAAERLYGYSADEAIGQPLSVLFPGKEAGFYTTLMEMEEGVRARYEGRDRRKDGSPVDVAFTVFPVRDAEGTITAISGIVRDISGRLQAEQDLRDALLAAEAGLRTKGLFLAMMSHELRTPLQAVLGYADFLLSQRPGELSDEQREDIGYIHQGASRMVHLIEQLLDLSRMEAGRLDLAWEPVDVRHVLETVRQDITPQAEAKGLAVGIVAPARLPKTWGDAGRVRQIVLNLAGNAVKFTEVGEIVIRAYQERGWVVVEVRDTGVGIAPEDLAHIFEEFRQVDGPRSRRHGGAGLGLAIAKRLAEQMGGSIAVESTPGQGSTFTLRLPVASRESTRAGRAKAVALA